MSCIEEGQLAQQRDNDTTTHLVYEASTQKRVRITKIILANVSGINAKIRVFKSPDNSTFDQDTAILYDANVPKNGRIVLEGNMYLAPGQSIGYQQGTANAITITVDGIEIQIKGC